jgi:hypothetical protein
LLVAGDLLAEDFVFVFAAVGLTEEFVFVTAFALVAEADLLAGLLTVLACGSCFCVLPAGNLAEAGFSCAALACAG